MNGRERIEEARFWREYEEMKARHEEARRNPPTRTRCKLCGEYNDDPDMPCACNDGDLF